MNDRHTNIQILLYNSIAHCPHIHTKFHLNPMKVGGDETIYSTISLINANIQNLICNLLALTSFTHIHTTTFHQNPTKTEEKRDNLHSS